MTTVRRAWAGTGIGILAATLAFPFTGIFHSGVGHLALALLPFVLIGMTLLAGPGAFLLSCLHAWRMELWAPHARSVGHIRKVGVLLGMPLGVANLVLLFMIPALAGQGPKLSTEMAAWLIPALAGGAGLGWGVTIGLTPGRAAPARATVRPLRRRAIRRDGPPFFDHRGIGRAG